MAFSSDGQFLAVGGTDWRIHLCDAGSGKEQTTLLGHQGSVAGLAFSPDNRVLASGGWDGTVRLWHVATGREVLTLDGPRGKVLCLAFSPDGETLVSGGSTANGVGEVLLWRAGR
jgi:WD40 repeat protein